ncbi:AbgT family transporter [Hallella seregens]|uniref:AbgT family transporter n=1 Tax=Hallella seregens ATCC 51272 TaxID=1336250 RepID=A0ABV5ZIK0_9BACT|nr:AbgT family transporter [Hallella seregens]
MKNDRTYIYKVMGTEERDRHQSAFGQHWGVTWRTWVYRLTLLLGAGQVALILASWLLAAAMPEMSVRSLLSAAGIRWFFGNFAFKLGSPLLVNLIVMAMAVGAVGESGLWKTLCHTLLPRRPQPTGQQRYALRASGLLLLIECAVMLLLTALPHAVLLSVTGELFPSSFSVSLLPVLAFMGATTAVSYGLLSGRLHSVYDVCQCLCAAGNWLMPLLLLYVLGAEFCHCFAYVLMG